jgi:hypothetical protein
MLFALGNFALFIGSVASYIWILRTLAQLRRDQVVLFAELDRIADFLGVPARRQLMVACSHCGSRYQPNLTGCPRCGHRKPDDLQPEAVVVGARDHSLDVLPPQ